MGIVTATTQVYAGPGNTGIYAQIGTLFANDSYTLIWNEFGYKYIEYPVTGGKKRGYIPGGTNVCPTNFNTGLLGIITEAQTVLFTPGNSSISAGSVSAGEKVTVLLRNIGGYSYIEFGSPSGTKRGWVRNTKIYVDTSTALAKMVMNTDTFSSPNAGAAKIGSLKKEEFVIILAENSSSGYIEYCINASPFRKQAYIPKSSYQLLNTFADIPPISQDEDVNSVMSIDSDVFAGPDNVAYAKIGSVSEDEAVFVIFKEYNWFYIRYSTANGKKQGFVPQNSVSNYVELANNVSDMTNSWTGCMDLSVSTSDVYSGPSISYVSLGTIGNNEPVTRLNYEENDYTLIEYATSFGAKRGYVPCDALSNVTRGNLGVVTEEDVDVYFDSIYTRVSGAVGINEYVVILAQDRGAESVDATYYIEYNTPSGRKRGFVKQSNIAKLGNFSVEVLSPFPVTQKSSTEAQSVYAGPGEKYANIGQIAYDELVTELDHDGSYSNIEYTVGTSFKRGYVPTSKLIVREFNISDMRIFADEKIKYGSSGMGRDLFAYRIGNGNHTMILNFTIHGWEDVWNNSGQDIERVGEKTLEHLFYYRNVIINRDWSVYVILASNPDGLLDGSQHNGPGRCTLKSYNADKTELVDIGVDMNRCFEYTENGVVKRYENTSNPRNYTGPYGACWAPEAEALRDFIADHKSADGENIFIDVHGYTNQILISQTDGRADLRTRFLEEFSGLGYRPNDYCAAGYVALYARDIHGMQGCLFEFPNTCTKTGDIKEKGYDMKFINVIKTILDSYPLS